ncbi:uncharacterized protein UBRO_01882 [Ustilago bromivora]|uniref:Uncharacterized protein n=1 Tax=Ustilago bromivora TaxID=307758 RepID=A0A1K0H904_9BASI|nr:uncharacterized protein UBRO_01882 [Ustilago bromivora]SYW83253.1 uncharacterized protein UBRO2_05144 [Ustilago bromivora]
MPRQLSAGKYRSARRADSVHPLNHRKSLQTKLQTSPARSSPYHRAGSFKSGPPSSRSASSVGGSPRPLFQSDDDLSSSGDDNNDLGSKHIPGIKLPIPTLAMSSRKTARSLNGKKPTKVYSSKKDRPCAERKASVRKERFEELDTDSDLTDPPSDDYAESAASTAGRSYSAREKGKARSLESDDLESDSDTEMERKLAEAGDGESLLGSGASGDDTEEEEERFIIQDALHRQSKAKARLQHRDPSVRRCTGGDRDSASRSDLQHRARSIAIGDGAAAEEAEADAEDDDEDDEDDDEDDDADADLLSMSPDTLRMYGLPVIEDELFEEQEAFNSSSEPSFTDFFETSTDSEMDIADAQNENGDDDDEFTTDSDEDRDISDLEGGLLDAPLIAHIGTAPEGDRNAAVTDAAADGTLQPKPEMPLLVIEDLDGRLIYARAGDGEAVFGSDGEFEFVDDSDDDSADWEFDQGGNRLWSGAGGHSGLLGAPEDDGDTTDELADEDMPYPRLLVGSVAPRGGRNARRARAMATNSRRLSPAAPSSLSSPSMPHTAQAVPASDSSVNGKLSSSGSGGSPVSSDEQAAANEVGITISTEELARDPEGTLKAAAAALGVTMEEAASLIAGVQIPAITGEGNSASGSANTSISGHASGTSSTSNTMAAPKVPEQQRVANVAKPQMGSFMPTSAKSVHRAVIDGSRKAPSPFSGKRSLEKKGLAKKRSAGRRSSLMEEGFSAKRLRRFSSANDAASALDEYSEMAPSSPEPVAEVDPMELDDVVDSSMIWRGTGSKSPSPEPEVGEGQDGGRRSSIRSARKTSSAPGLNLNAFSRWNKIPMGSFRDSQAAPAPSQNAFQQQQHQHQQPLGTFLLTRSQGQSGQKRTSSPFRSSSHAVRHPEMFSISPLRQRHEDKSNEVGGSNDSTLGRRRSFIISPVLFPTRGGEIPPPSSSSYAAAQKMPTYSQVAGMCLGGSSSGAGDAASVASGNSAGPGRITRREKRERRLKRAAMLASQAEDGAGNSRQTAEDGRRSSTSPMPTTPLSQLSGLQEGAVGYEEGDSPATAFPRMRITDATPTPRGSPGPHGFNGPHAVGKDLLEPVSSFNPQSYLTPTKSNGTAGQMASSETLASESVPSRVTKEPNVEGQDQDGSGTASMSGALPSSACKTPLHSPLFGGIFGGALNYDLEDKEAEHLRI